LLVRQKMSHEDSTGLSCMGAERRASLLVHQRNDLSRQSPDKLAEKDESVPEMRSI
jgi:hypothetical protein